MARVIELLLTENVENTGIVGDVVKVRKGFARNYLLPRGFATEPSPEKIKDLATKREEAQKQVAELRRQRESLVQKLEGHAVDLIRSCNDLGILYGGVTQQDVCDALAKDGFAGIKQRDVRIGGAIKRVGDYDLHVKFEADLEATIKLHVKPDRELDMGKRDAEPAAPAPATPGEAASPEAKAASPEAKAAKPEAKAEKAAKAPRSDKAAAEPKEKAPPDAAADGGKTPKPKGDKGKGKDAKEGDTSAASSKSKTGWGTTAEVPQGLADLLKPRRERRERR